MATEPMTLVEAVARAIYENDPESPFWHIAGGEHTNEYEWRDGSSESPHPYYRTLAEAALRAIAARQPGRAEMVEVVEAAIGAGEARGTARVERPPYPYDSWLNAPQEARDRRDDRISQCGDSVREIRDLSRALINRALVQEVDDAS